MKILPGWAPIVRTVVPGVSAIATRCSTGSSMKITVPAGASTVSPSIVNVAIAVEDDVDLLVLRVGLVVIDDDLRRPSRGARQALIPNAVTPSVCAQREPVGPGVLGADGRGLGEVERLEAGHDPATTRGSQLVLLVARLQHDPLALAGGEGDRQARVVGGELRGRDRQAAEGTREGERDLRQVIDGARAARRARPWSCRCGSRWPASGGSPGARAEQLGRRRRGDVRDRRRPR